MNQTPPQDSVSDVERAQWRRVLNLARNPGKTRADLVTALTMIADVADAALAVPINKIGEDAWQDMATAPRDGRYILVAIAEGREGHLAHQAGRMFVVRHAGMAGEYDMGWNLHPGYGGCSDFDFAGWMPAPQPPAIRRLSTSTDKGVSNGR